MTHSLEKVPGEGTREASCLCSSPRLDSREGSEGSSWQDSWAGTAVGTAVAGVGEAQPQAGGQGAGQLPPFRRSRRRLLRTPPLPAVPARDLAPSLLTRISERHWWDGQAPSSRGHQEVEQRGPSQVSWHHARCSGSHAETGRARRPLSGRRLGQSGQAFRGAVGQQRQLAAGWGPGLSLSPAGVDAPGRGDPDAGFLGPGLCPSPAFPGPGDAPQPVLTGRSKDSAKCSLQAKPTLACVSRPSHYLLQETPPPASHPHPGPQDTRW
ncbi:uncharacterized protein LOC110350620 isoform X2 [Heterocephalus glaber]|uniref:Uncharacterized protein LOC110350620 isoform X2 n=1 Tax=Heterocephalus glaber TaxID=10181 RepID=A0AAX6TFT3_HETGA|nr:uncharacterized protein LOC110350620 isoform X2 [Heterocephalus glaber]